MEIGEACRYAQVRETKAQRLNDIVRVSLIEFNGGTGALFVVA